MAALRLVIESRGGYTAVNGEKLAMLPGDLVLTPNWTWHDHANDSDEPMIWLDGLDSALVRMLEARADMLRGEKRSASMPNQLSAPGIARTTSDPKPTNRPNRSNHPPLSAAAFGSIRRPGAKRRGGRLAPA